MDSDIECRMTRPDAQLAEFVDFFWMLKNHSDRERNVVVLPDGRIDIFFFISAATPFDVVLLGLGSEPLENILLPKTVIFAVSFKLLAVEYLLDQYNSSLLNSARQLPVGFWDIGADDLNDFDHFCKKISAKIPGLISVDIDERKRKLFNLIYSSSGSVTVKKMAETVFWSSRQINRYFKTRFGISLKTYCNILRYRASFPQIKEGKLFPEQHFSDQAHFIKEIKKYSGVTPKELARNENDRFIQFTTLPPE